MGCDGGTIPRRDELVKLKKKPEQKDKSSELKYRWQHCALTQQKLQEPIVICGLGRLYSKQNVIEFLIEKKMPDHAKHIKSLKDVKEIKLMKNPVFNDDETRQTVTSAPYICRLMGLEMNGNFRFTALWSCGCIFAERALKEIKCKVCPICQAAYNPDDIVIINGDEDDVKILNVKMEQRVAGRKKKTKKSSTIVDVAESISVESTSSVADAIVLPAESAPCTGTSTTAETSSAIKINDTKVPVNGAASTSTTAEAGTIKIKDTKLHVNAVASSSGNSKFSALKRSNNEKYDDPDFKKSKNSYSVAQDPNATDVFKSLFTTHQSEKDQSRAHWITYNPFYN